MHPKKIKYLVDAYGSKEKMSHAIITGKVYDLFVGTPVIVNMGDFALSESAYYKFFDGQVELTKKTNIPALFSRNPNPAVVTECVHTSVGKTNVLIPFSFWNQNTDHNYMAMNTRSVYFTGESPILFDEGKQVTSASLSEVHSKDELKHFPDIVAEMLSKYRYVTYTLENIVQSNKKRMLGDIEAVFVSLRSKYKDHISFFQGDGHPVRIVIDSVVVSFYRMQDIIPIFDTKQGAGVVSEVTLTNSALNPADFIQKSITYRFIFSPSKENVFTIDGEKIMRPYDKPTVVALESMGDMIYKHAPYDNRSRGELQKPHKKELTDLGEFLAKGIPTKKSMIEYI